MPSYLTPGVYVEEVDRGSKPLSAVGTAVAAFVGFTAKYPTDDPDDADGLKPRLVTNWSQFETLYGGLVKGALLPHAVRGYFDNGGGSCYIVRIPHRKVAGPGQPRALPAAAPAGAPPSDKPADEKPVLEISAKLDDPSIEVAVEVPRQGDGNTFNLIVSSGGRTVETYSKVTLAAGEHEVATAVATSKLIQVKVASGVKGGVPAVGHYKVSPADSNREPVTFGGFDGNEAERTGIRGLVIADAVTMVAVPDLYTAALRDDGTLDEDLWKSVQTSLVTHCEGQANRMAILDAPPGLSPQKVGEWRVASNIASKFATVYYPWITVANSAGTNGDRNLTIPPCGHIAGIWARNDDTRGVWKAPANEVIQGALDVATKITKEEQGFLNPEGVNCIRPFGTRGIRVWGARTLSNDPSWQYVNVRRLFNMIETTIMEGTQWVVFEPNDQTLWERVKRTISAFLLGLWRDGALFGATAEQAFYVKCDAETNPPDSIDQGKLIVEVGIAPVKPAEFVIFRISQWQGGSSAE
jgi:phage tail sheath protein FI